MSVLKDYQELANKLPLEAFEQAGFISHSEEIDFSQAEKLDQYLRDAKPQQGWICYQSDIKRFIQNEDMPKRNEKTGYILNAEFVLDTKHSLHIHMAEQGWILNSIEEQAGNDLIENTHYLAMPAKDADEETMGNVKQLLKYRVLWMHDNENGYQPSHYRFTGFSEEKK